MRNMERLFFVEVARYLGFATLILPFHFLRARYLPHPVLDDNNPKIFTGKPIKAPYSCNNVIFS